ncbi:MAG TPA: VWA-like domain-containing protein [bacterium]|nr:VWA-like domain-containing protein [bacterium]
MTTSSVQFSVDEIIRIKKATLLAKYPFFGVLISYLKSEGHPAAWFEERGLFPTMATDGVRLLCAHEFVRKLQQDPLRDLVMGVLAHEVLHACLGHIWRRQHREPLLWNIAVDMVDNFILTQNQIDLPDDCVTIPSGWEKLSEEEIYERLRKNVNQTLVQAAAQSSLGAGDVLPPPMPGSGSGQDGLNGKDGVSGTGDPLAKTWKDRLIRAAQVAKSQGRLPAGISEIVDDLLRPQQDWRTLLALFVQPHAHDYDWLRPDRRLLGAYGLYLPTLFGEKIEDLVVAIDTSGSISRDELRTFLSELRGILQAYPHMHVYLVTCDAQVYAFQELTGQDPVPTEIQGRGGTDFRPVFDEIETRGLLPSAAVFLTDGMRDYPDEAPPYPVLWVLTPTHQEPPFGTVTVLDETASL